jgi:GT2 family glycosyltransferase
MRWRSTAKRPHGPDPVNLDQSETGTTASVVFDGAFYLREYPDIAAAGVDPLAHYTAYGRAEGRFPTEEAKQRWQIWDTAWYAGNRFPVATPACFLLADGQSLDGVALRRDFTEGGEALGVSPHPLFDPLWYLGQLDARPQAESLLDHYIDYGHRLSPHPLFDPNSPAAKAAPDGVNPLINYLSNRQTWSLAPNPFFDGEFYLHKYRDVREGTVAPLLHYAVDGRKEGREVSAQFWPDDPRLSAVSPGGTTSLYDVAREHLWLRWLDAEGISFPSRPEPDVTVIIPVWDDWPRVRNCLRALAKSRGHLPFEVLAVAADPATETADHLDRIPGLTVLRHSSRLEFGEACNLALWRARGRYIALLSHELRVEPDWLRSLATTLADPTVGMAGGAIVQSDGRLVEAGWVVYSDGSAFRYGRSNDPPGDFRYDYVRDADLANVGAVMIRREALHAMAGIDEWFAPSSDDRGHLTFALRQRGWRTVFQPEAKAVHGIDETAAKTATRQPEVNRAVSWQFADPPLSRLLERQPTPGPDTIERAVRQIAGGTVIVAGPHVPRPNEDAASLRLAAIITEIQSQGRAVMFVPADGQDGGPDGRRLRQLGVQVAWEADLWPEYFNLLRGTAEAVILSGTAAVARLGAILAQTQPNATIVFDTGLPISKPPATTEGDPVSVSGRAAQLAQAIETAVTSIADFIWVTDDDARQHLADAVPGADISVIPQRSPTTTSQTHDGPGENRSALSAAVSRFLRQAEASPGHVS